MSKQIPIHDQDKQTNVYLNAKHMDGMYVNLAL